MSSTRHQLLTRSLLLGLTLLAATAGADGQDITKSTGAANSASHSNRRSETLNRNRTHRANRVKSEGPRSSNVEQSDLFATLGDSFLEKNKWNAAEAAYREATKLYSGNDDAWAGLGELYVEKANIAEAEHVYGRLQGLNSQAAADLRAAINVLRGLK
jgi:tetratricopeptide (TPR) repeat protein